MKNYNEFTEDMKVRQDPDIKDKRDSTQIYGDMSRTKGRRHFEKKRE